MTSTIFIIIVVLEYFMDGLPMYKISVAQLETKRMQDLLPTKKLLVVAKAFIVVETILFVVACFLFLLKCLGAISWW